MGGGLPAGLLIVLNTGGREQGVVPHRQIPLPLHQLPPGGLRIRPVPGGVEDNGIVLINQLRTAGRHLVHDKVEVVVPIAPEGAVKGDIPVHVRGEQVRVGVADLLHDGGDVVVCIHGLDRGVGLQPGFRRTHIRPGLPGLQGPHRPVEGAQPVRLPTDQQILRGPGHKGEDHQGHHRRQQGHFHRLAERGPEKHAAQRHEAAGGPRLPLPDPQQLKEAVPAAVGQVVDPDHPLLHAVDTGVSVHGQGAEAVAAQDALPAQNTGPRRVRQSLHRREHPVRQLPGRLRPGRRPVVGQQLPKFTPRLVQPLHSHGIASLFITLFLLNYILILPSCQ